MSRLPSLGGDNGTWGDILNDFLSVEHNADGTLKVSGSIGSKYTLPAGGIPYNDLSPSLKAMIDNAVSGVAPDATTTSKGVIRLSGDLTGSALSPLIALGAVTGGGGGHIASGTITDANVNSSANIAKTKLAPLAITDSDVASAANISQSKVQNLPTDLAGKAALGHTHPVSDVTGLQSQLEDKADAVATQAALTSKANTADVSSALAAKADNAATTSALAGKANVTHTHVINDTTGLQTALNGKANVIHTHVGGDITDLDNSVADIIGNKLIPGDNVSIDYDAGSGQTTISATTSGGAEPSDTVTTVAGRTGDVVLTAGDITTGTFATARIPNLDADKIVTGTFNISRLPTGTTGTSVALGSHTHSIDDVANLGTALNGKANSTDVDTALAGKANTLHTHSATDITSGILDVDQVPNLDAGKLTSGTIGITRLPTGTTSSTVAIGNHNHDSAYAALVHNHDDRYYTETEVDAYLSTKLNSSEKGTVNGVATLGSDGKLPSSQLPAVAINDTFTASSQAAMLALTAQRGDVCIRTDTSKTYILSSDSPTTLADWKELVASGQVSSVNGQTGVVSLAPGDIGAAANNSTRPPVIDALSANTWPDRATWIAANVPGYTGRVEWDCAGFDWSGVYPPTAVANDRICRRRT